MSHGCFAPATRFRVYVRSPGSILFVAPGNTQKLQAGDLSSERFLSHGGTPKKSLYGWFHGKSHWLVVWNHGILWLSIQLGIINDKTNFWMVDFMENPMKRWMILGPPHVWSAWSHSSYPSGWWFKEHEWIMTFHSVGNEESSQLTSFHIFQRVGQPPTSHVFRIATRDVGQCSDPRVRIPSRLIHFRHCHFARRFERRFEKWWKVTSWSCRF